LILGDFVDGRNAKKLPPWQNRDNTHVPNYSRDKTRLLRIDRLPNRNRAGGSLKQDLRLLGLTPLAIFHHDK
jgi:hypothetical protein